MPVFYDQLNRVVNLPSTPKRIVSVVPSQTELLFYLGLNEEVVGITKFCIHPADKIKRVAKVGGTKTLDIPKIKKLQPDLIIANKEENDQGQIELLMKFFPVWISDITTLTDAIDMIERVGVITGNEAQANALNQTIFQKFNNLNIPALNYRAAYFIWRKPYMVAGANTFIDNMLQKCGFANAFELERYPEVYASSLVEANPDIVLLSSEPYPFKERHIAEFKALLPDAIIKIVDGEIFSWYGSKLVQAPEYFEKLTLELGNG